ncbi:hypothetical protein TNCV_372981 [Trichonephila clavipes]|nr:hypothetical protein TNCV_372981 [Trichonephila clavipes]
MKWMHLGEKTCQFNVTSPPISVRKQRICPLNETSGCDKKTTQQLVKMLQVSCKSIRIHHGALGNVKVLVYLNVQVVSQAAVIQIPEMGQYFKVDRKKSQLFKSFPLIRALDDDEASVSLGQVTKLAPDVKIQVFQRHGSGQVALQAEPFVNVTVGPSVFGSREEVGMIHRDIQTTFGSVPSSRMLAMDNSIGTG